MRTVTIEQTERRGLLGKYNVYDNPWAPGATDKGVKDLWKMIRGQDKFGKHPTKEEAEEDLPPAEVRELTNALGFHSLHGYGHVPVGMIQSGSSATALGFRCRFNRWVSHIRK